QYVVAIVLFAEPIVQITGIETVRFEYLNKSNTLVVVVSISSCCGHNRRKPQRVACLTQISHRDDQIAWMKNIAIFNRTVVVLGLPFLEAATDGKIPRRYETFSSWLVHEVLALVGEAVLDVDQRSERI